VRATELLRTFSCREEEKSGDGEDLIALVKVATPISVILRSLKKQNTLNKLENNIITEARRYKEYWWQFWSATYNH